MRVVVVGAWKREESEDVPLINDLLNALSQKYSQLIITTRGTDRGIGKIVKNRCMPKERGRQQGEFEFVEFSAKIYMNNPPKAELANIWSAVNAPLVEYGEEFYLFMDNQQGGAMQDLLDRVKTAGRPYATYYPGEKTLKLVSLEG